MTRAAGVVLIALALTAALALRCAHLDVRPMHHDEANQAIKFGNLLERGEYRYDFHDHHGPTLYYLTLPSAWLGGRHTLASLDEVALRRVPVAFGLATILLLPLLSPGIGRAAAAVAAILMAVSPAMVFYSRMFIQEALLTCFTLAFVIAIGRIATGGGFRWWMLAGFSAGLAVATKETSVIVLPVAILAATIAWWSLGSARPPNAMTVGDWRRAVAAALAVASFVAVLFYSSFFSAPAGILEPLRGTRTYLVRGIDPVNHAHPWHYYLQLLSYTSSAGTRWSEGLVVALAVVGAVMAWLPARGSSGTSSGTQRFWGRYLACDVAITAMIFSAIPYKTPWNVLPFYVVAFALAGIGFTSLMNLTRSRSTRARICALVSLPSPPAWDFAMMEILCRVDGARATRAPVRRGCIPHSKMQPRKHEVTPEYGFSSCLRVLVVAFGVHRSPDEGDGARRRSRSDALRDRPADRRDSLGCDRRRRDHAGELRREDRRQGLDRLRRFAAAADFGGQDAETTLGRQNRRHDGALRW